MTNIAKTLTRLFSMEERRKKEEEKRHEYHRRMSEKLFNIVQRGDTKYVTYD